MTLTPDQLLAIRKRADAATPGPWDDDTMDGVWGPGSGSLTSDDPGTIAEIYHDGNRTFVAHARSDIPALLDEVEQLQKRLDQTLMALGRIGLSMNPE